MRAKPMGKDEQSERWHSGYNPGVTNPSLQWVLLSPVSAFLKTRSEPAGKMPHRPGQEAVLPSSITAALGLQSGGSPAQPCAWPGTWVL